LPRNTGTIFLIDGITGQTQAILEGSWLTSVRTGAAAGLATDLLARSEADVLTIFGAGAIAPMQIWAMQTVRPLREVRVVNRNLKHYEQLLHTLREMLGENCPSVRHVDTASESLKGASLVVCATTTTRALFETQDIEPGTHINAVGAYTPEMCEIDAGTLARARIVVDQREAALTEAGELLQAHAQGFIGGAESWIELGALLTGEAQGRQSADEITVFKSVGLGIQDLTTASAVYKRAKELGIGINVEL
jgi:ornithine cyclodeaminase